MPLPPIDVDDDLEADSELESLEEPEPAEEMPDPMFAADVAEAFPDLEDAQILALERAFRGLMGGGMGGPPPMGL